jgi:prolyl-tRNA editing enzyme YbaK/EbsC (Cys-tRNA(Pro) deacylase)
MPQKPEMPALSLPPSVVRVIGAAQSLGLAITPTLMQASARTAQEAAAACGCDVAQIVKSLLFIGSDSGHSYLLLVSGAKRADERAMVEILGEPLRRPDAEAVRAITGFSIGGVPPFGHLRRSPVLLDEALLAFDVVWAAAGHPNAVFAIAPGELARVTDAKVTRME